MRIDFPHPELPCMYMPLGAATPLARSGSPSLLLPPPPTIDIRRDHSPPLPLPGDSFFTPV